MKIKILQNKTIFSIDKRRQKLDHHKKSFFHFTSQIRFIRIPSFLLLKDNNQEARNKLSLVLRRLAHQDAIKPNKFNPIIISFPSVERSCSLLCTTKIRLSESVYLSLNVCPWFPWLISSCAPKSTEEKCLPFWITTLFCRTLSG